MARRSKPDNSFEIAKLVLLLVLLGSFALSGGNLRGAVSLFIPLLIFFLIVGLAGFALYLIIHKAGRWGADPETFRDFENKAPGTPASDKKDPYREATPPWAFTQDLLDQLEWRHFEMLVQALFEAEGLIASRIRAGADGGIDLALQESPHGPVTAVVQCKAWKTYTVGVKPVRELFGVMHAEHVPHAFFFTSGRFTQEARAFADNKPVDLIDGNDLLLHLNSLEQATRNSILNKITAGDYTTPTCPSCDRKMVLRVSRYGGFWGCPSFPRCRQTFHIGTYEKHPR